MVAIVLAVIVIGAELVIVPTLSMPLLLALTIDRVPPSWLKIPSLAKPKFAPMTLPSSICPKLVNKPVLRFHICLSLLRLMSILPVAVLVNDPPLVSPAPPRPGTALPITRLPEFTTVPLLVSPAPVEPLMVRLPAAVMLSEAPVLTVTDLATANVPAPITG